MKKFIVLLTQRAGSTLTVEFLNSHPDITCFGERERRVYLQGLQSDTAVTGIKIMYNQLLYKNVQYINKHKVKVIHIVREDDIRRIVSHYFMAHRSGAYKESASVYKKMRPNIGVVDIDWALQTLRDERETARLIFDQLDTDLLTIKYSDIVGIDGNEVSEMPEHVGKKICDFLGVPFHKMTSGQRKRNLANPEEFVANYNELKEAIKRK